MTDLDVVSQRSRALGGALEPIIGQVYFSPEAHREYASLGFAGSSGELNGVALPDGPAYFTSRGSILGQVPGQLVAAAFAVFNPAAVVPAVEYGWTLTDAATICAARDRGAIGQLVRVLGESPGGAASVRGLLERAVSPLRPEGRPLFAGLSALAMPSDDLGAIWRLGDMLREFRGDAHTASWISLGLDATEIGLLTELYWGLPMRSYSRTRAWTDEQFDAATERLSSKGLVADGGLTDAGREVRESIEVATDAQMVPALRALGDDFDDLMSAITPWGDAVRAANGYPSSGPHDLAAAASPRR